MALPTRTNAVLIPFYNLGLADISGEEISWAVTACEGRLVQSVHHAGTTPLIDSVGGTFDIRKDTAAIYQTWTAATGILEVATAKLLPNTGADTDSIVGGMYEYTFVLTASNGEQIRTPEINFIIDADTSYTLTDDRIAYGDVKAIASEPLEYRTPRNVSFGWAVFESDIACSVGDGKIGFVAPAWLVSRNIVDMQVSVSTPGTTGTMDIQLRRTRAGAAVDVFSAPVTVASGAYTASNETVDIANDDIQAGDMFFLDRDTVHTSPALGLSAVVTAL